MNAEEAQAISNLHLQMSKSVVVLRINLKVKNARPIFVALSLKREVATLRIENTHIVEKKVAKYILSLKHGIWNIILEKI